MNLKKHLCLWGAVLFSIWAASCASGPEAVEKDPPQTIKILESVDIQETTTAKPAKLPVYVSYAPDFERMLSFRKLTKMSQGDGRYEKVRIEYLLERLSKTPYNFVRNGDAFGGRHAVVHLRYKYMKFRNEVTTAESFVKNIASGSRKSGEPYFLKIGRESYRLTEVLYNELQLLDLGLRKYREKQAILSQL